MLTPDVLRERLAEIAGKGYAAYRALLGVYDFGHYHIALDHIQKDPFASPTRARLRVPLSVARFPDRFLRDAVARTSTADWLARRAAQVIEGLQPHGRATRIVAVDPGGQTVLARSSVAFPDDFVELRLNITLPGEGRIVLHREAEDLFFSAIPHLSRDALLYDGAVSHLLRAHVERVEDQYALRARLDELGLVAFVADGSILPRAGDSSDLPMDAGSAVPTSAPPDLAVTVDLPNAGNVTGLGIPRGITLIVGGSFQGKSTILRALAAGVYCHVPGDGRDLVVTDATAVNIRTEPGRPVSGVDVRLFFRELPGGLDASRLSLQNASGTISQAVNVLEAIEAGSRLLLLDEDTCSMNFMFRDARMRELVSSDREPLIPFIDRVRYLRDEVGVSVVLATSCCGDYLDVADTVIVMEQYVPTSVTKQSRAVARKLPGSRVQEPPPRDWSPRARAPQPQSIRTRRGRKPSKVSAQGLGRIIIGTDEIDLSGITTLVDASQVRAIADAIEYASRSGIIDGRAAMREVAEEVRRRVDQHGLDCISPHIGRHPGDYAEFRALDLAAALNRLPTLSVGPAGPLARERDEDRETPAEEPTPAEPAAPRPRKRSRRPRRRKAEAPEPVAVPVEAQPVAEEAPETPRPPRRIPRQRPKAEAEPAASPDKEPGLAPQPEVKPGAPDGSAGEAETKARMRRRPARHRRKKPQADAKEIATEEAATEPQPATESMPSEADQAARRPHRRRTPRRRKPTKGSLDEGADH